MESRHAAQKIVIRIEAFGWFALRPFDLGSLKLRRDGTDHTGGDLILKIEDILKTTLETFRP